jgi:hypothetical protein
MVFHAGHANDACFLEGPIEQTGHCVPVVELVGGEGIVAEEVQGTGEQGSGIVQALNGCN